MAQPGMPQLDPTSFPSQLFWLTVTFVTLYVLMARFLLPRIERVIGKRESTLAGDLSTAAHARDAAETAKATYENALAESRAQAHQLLTDTTAAMNRNASGKQAVLDAELHTKVQQAERDVETARLQALAKLTPVAEELTVAIVEKLIQYKPSREEAKKAVADYSKQVA